MKFSYLKSILRELGFPLRNSDSNRKTVKLSNCKTVFTLVEMLVVMAIMAMLLYIAMPAFERMAKGGGTELAGRNMYNYLSLARSYAITNRQHVAVLFPMRGMNEPNPLSGIPSDYFNRSYRTCIVRLDGTTYRFVRWIPGDTWQFTPTGTLFLDTDGDASDDPVTDNSARNNGIGSSGLVSNVNVRDLFGDDDPARVDNVCAIIFRPTGRIAGIQRYVDIGEGKFDGSDIIVTNKNLASLVTVKVDQFTGRVSYGKD